MSSQEIPHPPAPAAARITISNWREHRKNTLLGFFDVELASGLILRGCMLHQKDEARWVGFPAREWKDQAGKTQYARFIEFRDRKTGDKFRDQVLAALDAYLQETTV